MDLTAQIRRLKDRFAQVEHDLGLPEVCANSKLMRELSKEHARLKRVMEAEIELARCRTELSDNELLVTANEDPELADMARAEIEPLKNRLQQLQFELQCAILPPDPTDDRNAIVEIRAGTGGTEAALFAADLYRMYTRYAESQGWKIEAMDSSPSDLGGYKEIIFGINGENIFRKLRFESGVHRVQRVPATEAQGRIHTSTATVAVLPEAEEVDLVINPNDLEVSVCRSGGPGGQGVNTTDSAVQILHKPTGLIVRCQDGRSQIKNREKAFGVLRSRLLEQKISEENAKYAAQRKSQVGSGDRNEKIRTYNFPQNRVTDHRINLTIYNLSAFIDGDISEMVSTLVQRNLEDRLAELDAAPVR
ncbi:MAG: peptide chain release factor 1 [Verrucomicrobiae bacterium]|nr:peptide chain release factor 1 [Verrucomicrobiae bacterium]